MPTTARRIEIDWEAVYYEFPEEMGQLDELVSIHESEQGISVSPGALHVLYIPIVEGLQAQEPFELGEINQTLKKIFEAIRGAPDPREEGTAERSSRSMLKAISEHWCGIPPICSRRDRRSQDEQ
jgi:hypothetical protein